jgi:putative endopeptidase
VQQQAADYYASYMDDAAIEAKGLAPLKPMLDRIAAIDSHSALSRALGEELRADVDALNTTNFHTDRLFGVWVTGDLNDPATSVPYLLQGGLDMPDREYYLADSPRMAAVRKEFAAHVSQMLRLRRVPKPTTRRARRRARNPHGARARDAGGIARRLKANNPWPRAEFRAKAPGSTGGVLLSGARLDRAHDRRVASGRDARAVGARAQRAACVVEALAHVPRGRSQRRGAAQAFVDARFAFHGKV